MITTKPIHEFAARLRAFMGKACPESPIPPGGQPSRQEEKSFNDLALELYNLQQALNPVYARLCQREGRSVVSHWTEIPPMPVSAFKSTECSCLQSAERQAEFHSSGTTGQATAVHFHHPTSLALYEFSLWRWFRVHCTAGLAGHRLIFMTPPPSQAPHSSLVYMFETVGRQLPEGEVSFVGESASPSGIWRLDLRQLDTALKECNNRGQPVGLLGTAFHFVHFLASLREANRHLQLPPGSWILETGGYKGRSRALPKTELHHAIMSHLGIPESRIIGEYGMCELSSQAYDRVLHPASADASESNSQRLFRFPPWARFRVLSPEDLQEVSPGQPGLIQVVDLANTWSALAVRTEDLGVRYGNRFHLLGRSDQSEPRGCSLQLA